jgi:hypothetical protein
VRKCRCGARRLGSASSAVSHKRRTDFTVVGGCTW